MVDRVDSIPVLGYICLLFCIFSYYIYLKIFRRDPRHVKFAETIPGPPHLPIIGHGLDFFRNGTEGVEKILAYTEKYGRLYRLWFGKHLTLVISKAEDLQAVFLSSKMMDKPDMCAPFTEIWGDSVFTVGGHAWRKQRKQIQPLYAKKTLPHYEESINGIIQRYVAEMAQHNLDGPEFDLSNWMPSFSFDIIATFLGYKYPRTLTFYALCMSSTIIRKSSINDRYLFILGMISSKDECMNILYTFKETNFDIELSTEERNRLKFHSNIKKLSSAMFWQSLRPWLHIRLFRLIHSWRSGVYSAQEKIYGYASEITRRKLILLEENKKKVADLGQGAVLSQFPFLSATYPESNDVGAMKRMYDEIATISAAATDTTALAISFFLLMVAIHSDIQDKLWEEIYAVYGEDKREATVDDFDRLPYLDAVFRETQRRFTAVPLIFRKVREDAKIGEIHVPAGTTLLISVIGIHNNPEYYDEPYRFDPDRFSPEKSEKRPRLSYIPFSAGIRNCVGMNFALLVVKLTIIAFLRAFKFGTSVRMEDIVLSGGFTTLSVNGYKVRITRRK